jgi:SAM-dependent methyltransferase
MKDFFTSDVDSHYHSLQTLNQLYEYDDFMISLETMADMGCGTGLDLEWWATRTTRDDTPRPLNIKCTGVDIPTDLAMAQNYRNITYKPQNFEDPILRDKKLYDVLWCHNAFQYAINPIQTLINWRKVMSPDGMLILVLPQTTNLDFKIQAFDQRDGCYYNWTMVSLIHVLAVAGFDCAGGFFKKNPDDPWLHAIVYNGTHEAMDPRTARWYDLAERQLLPASAADSVQKYGYLKQRDLVLPWLDKSMTWMGNH